MLVYYVCKGGMFRIDVLVGILFMSDTKRIRSGVDQVSEVNWIQELLVLGAKRIELK